MLSGVISEGFGSVNSPLCTDAPPNVKKKNGACSFQDRLGRKRKKINAEFLPLPNVAHLPALGTLKDEGKKKCKSEAKNQGNCLPLTTSKA